MVLTYIAAEANANLPFDRDTNIKFTNFIGESGQNALFTYINQHTNSNQVDLGTATTAGPWRKSSTTVDMSGCKEFSSTALLKGD